VSAVHAQLDYDGGEWRLTDLTSRNGTFVNGSRVDAPTPLRSGDVISLGETGPRLLVAAVTDGLPSTLPERPGIREPGEDPHARPEARAYGIMLLDAGTGRHYEARGVRIRMGRGHECEVKPVDAPESVVSRVHAELTVSPSGGLAVRDAGSKHGTFLNDERVTTPVPVRLGDRITLGRGGPALIVVGLGTAPAIPAARRPGAPGQRTVGSLIARALARSKGDSRRKLGWLVAVVIALVLLLAGAMYGVY
jgi:pSer/pThr/pTyr-binding forkhead associated (FHA) protein